MMAEGRGDRRVYSSRVQVGEWRVEEEIGRHLQANSAFPRWALACTWEECECYCTVCCMYSAGIID